MLTLGEIYRKVIEVGKTYDWRGQACIDGILEKARAESSQPGFDQDRLFNPYGDARIAVCDPKTPVKSILVALNLWPKEVLLAGQMRCIGKPVDLCISHRWSCVNLSLAFLGDILLTHKYCLQEVGVPREKYEGPVDRWIANPGYKMKLDTINTAKHLDIPLLVVHTACDLIHVKRARDIFNRLKDRSLGEVVEALSDTAEFKMNPYEKIVIHGNAKAKPGKVYNSIGAGWHPRIELFELACQAGINTALVASPSKEHLAMGAKYEVAIVAIPSDPNCNYGVNIMLDELERSGPLTIYEANNFTRVRRV